ncbi:MAG TPA: GNAT family N-acetyltransferase [Flavobacterium sp.]|jgi:ElaA protein
MPLKWKIKPFKALSPEELYSILQLRSEIFVVEQNCVYQDLDGKDQKALHVFGIEEGRILASSRLFAPGDYFAEASIGRVVVKKDARARKLGHELMQESMNAIKENFGSGPILISAQLYLEKFYNSHGFISVGEKYLEDDIPHIRMLRD